MSWDTNETMVPVEQETIVLVEHRPFMTTNFEDYTVQEGLSLVMCVLLMCLVFLKLIGR